MMFFGWFPIKNQHSYHSSSHEFPWFIPLFIHIVDHQNPINNEWELTGFEWERECGFDMF
jgi:hypothetical protein